MKVNASLLAGLVFGCAPAIPSSTTSAAENQGIFMAVTTNIIRITNQVVVTNLVVSTNFTFTTNYYNSQGQLLTPVQSIATAATAKAETKPATPVAAGPDPAVVRSNRVRAVRELLSQSIGVASNTLSASGAFTGNAKYQIRIPDGVTVFDRKKERTLLTAMNTAAERAVPSVAAMLQKSVADFNPADPVPVLQGDKDAATRALLSAQGANITNQVLAIVESTAANANVPEAYNAAMLRGGGLLGAVLGTSPSVDINAHITQGLIDAVIANITAHEYVLRTDSSARKTKALQEAFAK